MPGIGPTVIKCPNQVGALPLRAPRRGSVAWVSGSRRWTRLAPSRETEAHRPRASCVQHTHFTNRCVFWSPQASSSRPLCSLFLSQPLYSPRPTPGQLYDEEGALLPENPTVSITEVPRAPPRPRAPTPHAPGGARARRAAAANVRGKLCVRTDPPPHRAPPQPPAQVLANGRERLVGYQCLNDAGEYVREADPGVLPLP